MGGERSFFHFPGASHQFPGPCHVHLGGSPLISAYDGPQGLAMLTRARDLGVSTSLDTVGNVNGSWELTRTLLAEIDLAMPSWDEAICPTMNHGPTGRSPRIVLIRLVPTWAAMRASVR